MAAVCKFGQTICNRLLKSLMKHSQQLERGRNHIVAVLRSGYPEQRNILHATSIGFIHVFAKDYVSFLEKLWHRLSGNSYSKFLHSFSMPVKVPVGVIHTFNSIVFSRLSWVVTFETTLPRESHMPPLFIRLAWRRLADERCLSVVALSECARQRLLDDLKLNQAGLAQDQLELIRGKVTLLHPPQSVLVEFEDKVKAVDFDGSLKLALIGHDFYRKGGLEVLLALDVLLDEGLDVQLNIAGKMAAGDYASRAGESEVAKAEALIEKHSSQINLMGSQPSTEVLALLRRSHIVCLPTWGETYGYSVLEGQASGCAAITTDIRALPEINNNECGWVIQVPKLANEDGDLGTSEKRDHFRKVLVSGLILAFREAHDDRIQLRNKARASLERIRCDHDPEMHAARLSEIYSKGTK